MKASRREQKGYFWVVIDWLAIPSGTRAKSVDLWHGAGNVVAVVLFIVSWLLRVDALGEPGAISIILSLLGVDLAGSTGWLGGELVERVRFRKQPGPVAQALWVIG